MNVFIDQYDQLMINKTIEINSIITAFEIIYDSEFYYKGEAHDFWELVCVVDGEINVTADNNILELHKNQIIFHRPMEFHRLWSANGTTPHLIIMSFGIAQPIPLKEAVYTISDEDIKELSGILKLGKDVFNFKNICVISQKESKIIDVQCFINRLELLLLSILKENAVFDAISKSQSANNYAKIIKVLKSNLDKTLTIDDVASLANMSKSSVKKTFERYANEGIMKYFTNLKIIEAIHLLESGMSVGQVGSSLGFTEQNYFSTVFKRVTGYSPTKYFKR